jgi:hypothetical protein
MLHQIGQIHAVELVPGKDENYVIVPRGNVLQIFAHSIGIPHVPVLANGAGLFSGKNVNDAITKIVKAIGEFDVPVQ